MASRLFMFALVAMALALPCLGVATDSGDLAPQAVHLAFAGRDGMAVSWLTMKSTANSTVKFGVASGAYTHTASGSATNYDHYAGYNHNVVLRDLQPGQRYFYVCGDGANWSKEFDFVNPGYPSAASSSGAFTAAVYGDLGVTHSADTIKRLVARAEANEIDFSVHAGDISYANDHPITYEKTWRGWFNSMEPSMARFPYMTAVGNHESWCRNPVCAYQTLNFTAYKEKFRMPGAECGSNAATFYSFDRGLAHFLMINTEQGFPGHPSIDPARRDVSEAKALPDEDVYEAHSSAHRLSQLEGDNLRRVRAELFAQVNFVEQDLAAAVANRDKVPWIIVVGHRPVYSSTSQKNGVPTGEPKYVQAWLEPLFDKYKVDVYVAGHVHHYERILPTYQNKPVNGTTNYVVVGGAGNFEALDGFPKSLPEWHASGNSQQYGYGLLKVESATEAKWEYHRADTDAVTDEAVFQRHA